MPRMKRQKSKKHILITKKTISFRGPFKKFVSKINRKKINKVTRRRTTIGGATDIRIHPRDKESDTLEISKEYYEDEGDTVGTLKSGIINTLNPANPNRDQIKIFVKEAMFFRELKDDVELEDDKDYYYVFNEIAQEGPLTAQQQGIPAALQSGSKRKLVELSRCFADMNISTNLLPDGRTEYTFENGNVHVGFMNSSCLIYGQGIFTDNTLGIRCEGLFWNGDFITGTITTPQKIMTGDFWNGDLHGQGRMENRTNGRVYTGTFRDGKIVEGVAMIPESAEVSFSIILDGVFIDGKFKRGSITREGSDLPKIVSYLEDGELTNIYGNITGKGSIVLKNEQADEIIEGYFDNDLLISGVVKRANGILLILYKKDFMGKDVIPSYRYVTGGIKYCKIFKCPIINGVPNYESEERVLIADVFNGTFDDNILVGEGIQYYQDEEDNRETITGEFDDTGILVSGNVRSSSHQNYISILDGTYNPINGALNGKAQFVEKQTGYTIEGEFKDTVLYKGVVQNSRNSLLIKIGTVNNRINDPKYQYHINDQLVRNGNMMFHDSMTGELVNIFIVSATFTDSCILTGQIMINGQLIDTGPEGYNVCEKHHPK